MTDKLNFLYCFDENYNKQAFASMISYLDKVSESINIFVVHNTDKFLDQIPDIIKNHKKLNKIISYKFKEQGYFFPNLKNNHISEATYYRLFIENYLDRSLKNIFYVDPDTICVSDPISSLKKRFQDLINSEYIISARTEILKSEINNYETFYINDPVIPFKRLGIDNYYFNAGVILIDYQKWLNSKLTKKLIDKLEILKDEIIAWDQDVLNSAINGNYIELSNEFNTYQTEVNSKSISNIMIIHYLGSKKPWTSRGALDVTSKYYHNNYLKISGNAYHLLPTRKKNMIQDLFHLIFKFKFLKTEKSLSLIKEIIFLLLKSNK